MGSKYIVIDGLDGAGKSSVMEKLDNVFPPALKLGGYAYIREPGGTTLGERLRDIIIEGGMDPFTEFCLFCAQRREVKQLVSGLLARGRHVISDRSDSATFAYQVRGRQMPELEEIFWKMRELLVPHPSLYIFLDVSAEVAKARMVSNMAKKQDRFEREGEVFHNRVREAFREFSIRIEIPCRFVNAENSPEVVAQEVVSIVREHLSSS